MISTVRLYLTPISLSDAPRVRHLAGAEAVARNALGIPHPFLEGMAEAWIGGFDQSDAVFAIREEVGAPLVGLVGLEGTGGDGVAELSYWIGELHWGRGYATEAAAALVAYGFEHLRLHRVFSTSLVRNPASGRVLEKVGMQEEGVLRQHVWHWDRYEDLRFHGMLEGEYVVHREAKTSS